MSEHFLGNATVVSRSVACRHAGLERERPRLLWLGATLALGLFSVGGGVMAQSIPQIPTGQTLQPRQEPDNRTPSEREAENYDPRGTRMGSFMLFPSIELDETYDDNIYASSTGQLGSLIQIAKPAVEMKSTWSEHMVHLYARSAFGFYTADPSQNYQDVSVGTDGRFDILQTANVYGGTSFNHGHEALGTPNTAIGPFALSQYNQTTANAGYFQQFGRFKTQFDGRMDNFAFNNNGAGPAQGLVLNTDRNRTEFRENARLGYEFLRGYEIWTGGGLNQRRYDNGVDSLGFARNSTGWLVVGGATVAISTITSIEAFVGYLAQNYVDPRFTPISTPTFGLTGFWSPIREVAMKPYIRRTVDDTSLVSASGYLNTSGGLDGTYNFLPNVRFDGHADYSVADYQTVAGSAGRYDQYYTFRGGILYFPTENFFVGPSYQFVHRTSNQVGSNYNESQIMFRLGARL